MKVSLLLLTILVGSLWLHAAAAGSSQKEGSKSAGSASNSDTIAGCLQREGTRYVLTQKDGTTQQISGSKLKQYVGHEVELAGTHSFRTIDTTQPGTASSAVQQPYFRVRSVKDVAATCQPVR